MLVLPLMALLTAQAAQIQPEEVGRDEVLRAATHILVVEPADPPHRVVDDGMVHDAPCPYGVDRFVVSRVISTSEGGPTAGATIEVAQANFELYCAMQQAMDAGDPVPSPIIPEYHSGRQPPSEGPRVVYLCPSGNGPLRLAISNAWDPITELETLERILKLAKAIRGAE